MLSGTLVTELFHRSSNRPITNYARNPELLTRAAFGLDAFPLLYPNAVRRDYVPSFVLSGTGSRVANAPINNT